jgi:hypothetical protein
MNKNLQGIHSLIAALALPALSACGMMGDTSSVRDANKLAIECRTDEALAAVEHAEQGGGLSSYIADLQKVVILRDAGRMAEAEAAMAARNERADASAENIAEAEEAVEESLAELRAERKKKTGSATCP